MSPRQAWAAGNDMKRNHEGCSDRGQSPSGGHGLSPSGLSGEQSSSGELCDDPSGY